MRALRLTYGRKLELPYIRYTYNYIAVLMVTNVSVTN